MEDFYKEMHVLIVDDEEDIRFVVRDHLSDLGCRVHEARNGKEALKTIQGGLIDVVLMDIMMPEMNGIDLLKNVHENNPDIVCIMLTAHGSKESAIEALRANAFDFIEKPFERETLLLRVRNGLKMRYFQKYINSSLNAAFDEGNDADPTEVLEQMKKTLGNNNGGGRK